MMYVRANGLRGHRHLQQHRGAVMQDLMKQANLASCFRLDRSWGSCVVPHPSDCWELSDCDSTGEVLAHMQLFLGNADLQVRVSR